jgi:flotillin
MGTLIYLLPVIGLLLAALLIPMTLRRVVQPNEVHIVQSGGTTRTYGKDQKDGNAYYEWPAWLPRLGVQTVALPLSVFQLQLTDYAAYDQDKVPFLVDITAFFRISDPAKAAERVADEEDLDKQLKSILQGAARTVLAKSPVETIMVERSQYGQRFTEEVEPQLKEWGVSNVKMIELMDIRDAEGTRVIANIMARKEADIERHSRMTVADMHRQASIAETEAEREQQLAVQEAAEQVGKRAAVKEQNIGIATQLAKQAIAVAAAVTAEKDMAVQQVSVVRAAEIERERQVVVADQQQRTTVIAATAAKQTTVLKAEATSEQLAKEAEGKLAAKLKEAEGIAAEGTARADAETKMQVAKGVAAQAELAKTIGESAGYQDYLIRIRDVERLERVGVAQAVALDKADVKVIVQGGTPAEGLTSVMDLFSGKGGQAVGTAIEAIANNPTAKKLLGGLLNGRDKGAAA